MDSLRKIEEKKKFSKVPTHSWAIATYLLGALSLILVIIFISGFSITGKTISEKEIAPMIENFINTQLVPGGDAQVQSVKEESGLYVASVNLNNQVMPIYFTKDGKFITH